MVRTAGRGKLLPYISISLHKERSFMDFKLVSDYRPTGDQPQAIEKLTNGVRLGMSDQVLLGVTGSSKTFTMEIGRAHV